MIPEQDRQAILTLHAKGIGIRKIRDLLGRSRKTIRRVIQGVKVHRPDKLSQYEALMPLVAEQLQLCRGNAVRVWENLENDYGVAIPYSSLTDMIRKGGLRADKVQRSGEYDFLPGQECQHDTSPHRVHIGDKTVTAQCAGCALAYSRKLFVQYYPNFTRFEAKVFLTEAFSFFEGVCPSCIIDNTSVIVAHGSGANADIAPEMEAFGNFYGVTFRAHEIGHADRKPIIERDFAYVEGNFLAGRSFGDWHDLNQQARQWCIDTANKKPKRSLERRSPDQVHMDEKKYLIALPAYIPPVYKTLHRIVDMNGYVSVDTNRYSVPEPLVGKQVEVHKSWHRLAVFFGDKKVADHDRYIDRQDAKSRLPGHHTPFGGRKRNAGPSNEERRLLGHTPALDHYVAELKKRSHGRGVRKLKQLLDFKRSYPGKAFNKAIEQAGTYGLYDLNRLERMILSYIAGDVFNL